jgi:acyl-CoA thioester hydrolase
MDGSRIKVRVYYEDTDFGGVVYYGKYLRYMEQGRTEFFRDRGINLADCQKNGVVFAVIDVHIKYKASARYDDLLDVETSLSEVRNASMVFDTKIFDQQGTLLITSKTKVACMNGRGRATRIPAEIMEKVHSQTASQS